MCFKENVNMKNKKPSKACMGNLIEGLEDYFSNPVKKKNQTHELPSNTDSNRMEEQQTLKKVRPKKKQGPKM
jgi:hypothetical protein